MGRYSLFSPKHPVKTDVYKIRNTIINFCQNHTDNMMLKASRTSPRRVYNDQNCKVLRPNMKYKILITVACIKRYMDV